MKMKLQALPLRVIDPAGNRSSAEKIELGRWLFFDPLLKHLHLEAEDFVEVLDFLDALNGENWDKTIPDQVPAG
ncbi:MAG: cytochrome-c peroxidase [Verrucomicrobiales bacterium]|nr:cytochrome-c peroxidase [Verrucomicrobiales bacterium]